MYSGAPYLRRNDFGRQKRVAAPDTQLLVLILVIAVQEIRHTSLKMFVLSSDEVYSKFSHSQSFCMKKLKPTFPKGFLFSKKSTVFSSSGECSIVDLMTTAMYNIVYKLQRNSCTAIQTTM